MKLLVLVIVVGLLGAELASSSRHGFTTQCFDGSCYSAASTSAVGVLVSWLMIAVVLAFPRRLQIRLGAPPVAIWRRVLAFLIDSTVVIAALAPIVTVPILIVEWQAVGVFEWSFSRSYPRPSDMPLAAVSAIVMVGALFAYFYFHARAARQTVAQYVLGFTIQRADSLNPNFGKNFALAALGFCVWPVSIVLAARRPDKAFWWNLGANVRTVRTV